MRLGRQGTKKGECRKYDSSDHVASHAEEVKGLGRWDRGMRCWQQTVEKCSTEKMQRRMAQRDLRKLVHADGSTRKCRRRALPDRWLSEGCEEDAAQHTEVLTEAQVSQAETARDQEDLEEGPRLGK